MKSSIQTVKKNVSEVSDGDKPKIIMEPVREKLLIGISPYGKKITDDIEQFLTNRFNSEKYKKCEVCGVSISEKMRHPLSLGNAWFNSCGMCYYTANMDRIPHYETGSVVYFPYLDQERLNGMLRALWCMEYMCLIEPDNKDLNLFQDSISELTTVIKNSKFVSEGYFATSKPEVYTSTLFLLKPEEYRQRYKLLNNFKWFPDKRIFEDEIPFWVENDYMGLHPEKISSNITKFMSQYVKDFDIKNS